MNYDKMSKGPQAGPTELRGEPKGPPELEVRKYVRLSFKFFQHFINFHHKLSLWVIFNFWRLIFRLFNSDSFFFTFSFICFSLSVSCWPRSRDLLNVLKVETSSGRVKPWLTTWLEGKNDFIQNWVGFEKEVTLARSLDLVIKGKTERSWVRIIDGM